ncbi:MAG: hypothetical protein FJW94_01830 [Actinobacteria bacterium]|nr:hypothetical protein [Actinomycetota bacterium]
MPGSVSVRSIATTPGRVAALERTVEDLQLRVADLEASLAAIHAVRDEVRRLATSFVDEGDPPDIG